MDFHRRTDLRDIFFNSRVGKFSASHTSMQLEKPIESVCKRVVTININAKFTPSLDHWFRKILQIDYFSRDDNEVLRVVLQEYVEIFQY